MIKNERYGTAGNAGNMVISYNFVFNTKLHNDR